MPVWRVGSNAVSDCLACDLTSGKAEVPGGMIFETPAWRVEHCVGPLGVGTLVVKPKRHVLGLAGLEQDEAHQMGPLLWNTAAAVEQLTEAQQVYVCLWSHGPVHLHYVVQPELSETTERFGGHGPHLQAAMFEAGEPLDRELVAEFAGRARRWFAAQNL
jgi:diadenosine tetraphosphate (Ap4A) HIT family hydrolase